VYNYLRITALKNLQLGPHTRAWTLARETEQLNYLMMKRITTGFIKIYLSKMLTLPFTS
jgi:hypothetical protein